MSNKRKKSVKNYDYIVYLVLIVVIVSAYMIGKSDSMDKDNGIEPGDKIPVSVCRNIETGVVSVRNFGTFPANSECYAGTETYLNSPGLLEWTDGNSTWCVS
jgi:hypothetical protein